MDDSFIPDWASLPDFESFSIYNDAKGCRETRVFRSGGESTIQFVECICKDEQRHFPAPALEHLSGHSSSARASAVRAAAVRAAAVRAATVELTVDKATGGPNWASPSWTQDDSIRIPSSPLASARGTRGIHTPPVNYALTTPIQQDNTSSVFTKSPTSSVQQGSVDASVRRHSTEPSGAMTPPEAIKEARFTIRVNKADYEREMAIIEGKSDVPDSCTRQSVMPHMRKRPNSDCKLAGKSTSGDQSVRTRDHSQGSPPRPKRQTWDDVVTHGGPGGPALKNPTQADQISIMPHMRKRPSSDSKPTVKPTSGDQLAVKCDVPQGAPARPKRQTWDDVVTHGGPGGPALKNPTQADQISIMPHMRKRPNSDSKSALKSAGGDQSVRTCDMPQGDHYNQKCAWEGVDVQGVDVQGVSINRDPASKKCAWEGIDAQGVSINPTTQNPSPLDQIPPMPHTRKRPNSDWKPAQPQHCRANSGDEWVRTCDVPQADPSNWKPAWEGVDARGVSIDTTSRNPIPTDPSPHSSYRRKRSSRDWKPEQPQHCKSSSGDEWVRTCDVPQADPSNWKQAWEGVDARGISIDPTTPNPIPTDPSPPSSYRRSSNRRKRSSRDGRPAQPQRQNSTSGGEWVHTRDVPAGDPSSWRLAGEGNAQGRPINSTEQDPSSWRLAGEGNTQGRPINSTEQNPGPRGRPAASPARTNSRPRRRRSNRGWRPVQPRSTRPASGDDWVHTSEVPEGDPSRWASAVQAVGPNGEPIDPALLKAGWTADDMGPAWKAPAVDWDSRARRSPCHFMRWCPEADVKMADSVHGLSVDAMEKWLSRCHSEIDDKWPILPRDNVRLDDGSVLYFSPDPSPRGGAIVGEAAPREWIPTVIV